MNDTTSPTAYLSRLIGLMNGTIHTPLTPETIITGTEWRRFYLEHWPKEFWIDEIGVDFEDDYGTYALDDRARHPLDLFGRAVWQGADHGPFSQDVMIDIHLLYAAVMGCDLVDIVSFQVPAGKRDAVIAAAIAAGATPA